MRDLLAQVRQAASHDDNLAVPDVVTVDPEGTNVTLEQIAVIRDATVELQRLADQVDSAYRQQLQEYSQEAAHSVLEHARSLEQQFNSRAHETRNLLRALKARLDTPADDQEARMIRTHHGALLKRFVDVLGAYRDAQDRNRASQRDAFARSCRIVQPEISDGDIDRLVQRPEIFAADLAAVEAACRDVQTNHDLIVCLERALDNLHDLFLDMAVIIDSQSDLIDNVERTTRCALDHVAASGRNAAAANEYRRSFRRKQWCICVWLFVLAAIVALVVLLTV
jgi:t-SNARE complex subunit (syntaxin)